MLFQTLCGLLGHWKVKVDYRGVYVCRVCYKIINNKHKERVMCEENVEIDLRSVEFVGTTATGREVRTKDINSISFSINEGIYYIDNIPCQQVVVRKW